MSNVEATSPARDWRPLGIVADGQAGSYRFVRRISTDKHARV